MIGHPLRTHPPGGDFQAARKNPIDPIGVIRAERTMDRVHYLRVGMQSANLGIVARRIEIPHEDAGLRHREEFPDDRSQLGFPVLAFDVGDEDAQWPLLPRGLKEHHVPVAVRGGAGNGNPLPLGDWQRGKHRIAESIAPPASLSGCKEPRQTNAFRNRFRLSAGLEWRCTADLIQSNEITFAQNVGGALDTLEAILAHAAMNVVGADAKARLWFRASVSTHQREALSGIRRAFPLACIQDGHRGEYGQCDQRTAVMIMNGGVQLDFLPIPIPGASSLDGSLSKKGSKLLIGSFGRNGAER